MSVCIFSVCVYVPSIAWDILNRNIPFFWQLFVNGNSHGKVRYGVTALNTVVGEQVSDLLRPVELFTFSWPVAIHG